MAKTLQLIFLSVFIIWTFVLSCGCQSTKNKSKSIDIIDNEVLFENFIEIENLGVTYKIPTPIELFIFIEKTEAPYLNDKTHNTEKWNNYPSRKSQALNFGIYSADLAYCSVFGDFQATLKYFNAAKNLATSLGLHEGYGETIAQRIDKNISNIDSLIEISADSYYLANQFLEDQGQKDILGLILVGGWIEGLYLTIKSVDGVNIDNPIIERIADQQILLENLLGYLRNSENSKNISEVISNLEDIQEVFDELYFNDENTIITTTQFVNISNEVISLRNYYIN